MIKNIGIDIIENKRIKLKDNFVKKILSDLEYNYFIEIKNKKRKIEYLSGRWAAKESIFKVLNRIFLFNKVSILQDDNFKLIVKNLNLLDNESIFISLSHEKKYTISVSILCENNKNK